MGELYNFLSLITLCSRVTFCGSECSQHRADFNYPTVDAVISDGPHPFERHLPGPLHRHLGKGRAATSLPPGGPGGGQCRGTGSLLWSGALGGQLWSHWEEAGHLRSSVATAHPCPVPLTEGGQSAGPESAGFAVGSAGPLQGPRRAKSGPEMGVPVSACS